MNLLSAISYGTTSVRDLTLFNWSLPLTSGFNTNKTTPPFSPRGFSTCGFISKHYILSSWVVQAHKVKSPMVAAAKKWPHILTVQMERTSDKINVGVKLGFISNYFNLEK